MVGVLSGIDFRAAFPLEMLYRVIVGRVTVTVELL